MLFYPKFLEALLQGLKGKDEADAIDLADAFMMGKEVAYKAVIRPVEGTILTVCREAAQALNDAVEQKCLLIKLLIFYLLKLVKA